MIKIHSPKFVYSCPKVSMMQDFGEEMAFIGRSNSGKSSLINALCQKKDLAKTSKTPGRTRHAVVYHLEMEHEGIKKPMVLVDLPGYGFASMSKTEAFECENLIFDYLEQRENLKVVFLLLDIRREPDDREHEMIQKISDRGITLYFVMTKSDKLPVSKLKPAKTKMAKLINIDHEQILLHSVNESKFAKDIAKIAFTVIPR